MASESHSEFGIGLQVVGDVSRDALRGNWRGWLFDNRFVENDGAVVWIGGGETGRDGQRQRSQNRKRRAGGSEQSATRLVLIDCFTSVFDDDARRGAC